MFSVCYDWYLNFTFYSKMYFQFYVLFSKCYILSFYFFKKSTILGTFSKTFYGRYLPFRGVPHRNPSGTLYVITGLRCRSCHITTEDHSRTYEIRKFQCFGARLEPTPSPQGGGTNLCATLY